MKTASSKVPSPSHRVTLVRVQYGTPDGHSFSDSGGGGDGDVEGGGGVGGGGVGDGGGDGEADGGGDGGGGDGRRSPTASLTELTRRNMSSVMPASPDSSSITVFSPTSSSMTHTR